MIENYSQETFLEEESCILTVLLIFDHIWKDQIIFEMMFFICWFKTPSSLAFFFIPSNWLVAGIVNDIFMKRSVLSFRFSCLNVLVFSPPSASAQPKLPLTFCQLSCTKTVLSCGFPANFLWAGTWDGGLWIRAPERTELSVPRIFWWKSCLKKMVPLLI